MRHLKLHMKELFYITYNLLCGHVNFLYNKYYIYLMDLHLCLCLFQEEFIFIYVFLRTWFIVLML